MSALLSQTLKALLLTLVLTNLTGVLFSDGSMPVKLADKRAPTIFLDSEAQKFTSTPVEPHFIQPNLTFEFVPILTVMAHRSFLIVRLPKATGPPNA